MAKKFSRVPTRTITQRSTARKPGPLNAPLSGRYNYFDPQWHPYYHGTDLHTMQSVSKTVTSVIIGAAMQRGDFKAGLDTPILKYFDVSKVKKVHDRKRRITLRDVLTMTPGLEWHEEDVPYADPRSDSGLMEATDDWVQYRNRQAHGRRTRQGLELQQRRNGTSRLHLSERNRSGH